MAEYTYEGMFLLDSNKYASNPDGMSGEVLAIIERAGGKLLASRPWQDSKLAYQIDGHRKGLYYLTYFTIDSQKLAEISRLCKFNEAILRQLMIKLDPALVEPMVNMALGKGDIVSSFHDTEQDPVAAAVVAVDAVIA